MYLQFPSAGPAQRFGFAGLKTRRVIPEKTNGAPERAPFDVLPDGVVDYFSKTIFRVIVNDSDLRV